MSEVEVPETETRPNVIRWFDIEDPDGNEIAALTDLFYSQPLGAPEYVVFQMGEWEGMFAGQERSELGGRGCVSHGT